MIKAFITNRLLRLDLRMLFWSIPVVLPILADFFGANYIQNNRHLSKMRTEWNSYNGEAVIDYGWDPSPSIHFRHRGQANVGWADGHVSSEKMGKYDGINDDGVRPTDMDLGWFEPMDNTSFDLK